MSYIQISEADRCSVDHGVHLDIYWMLFVMCVHLHLNVYVWSVLCLLLNITTLSCCSQVGTVLHLPPNDSGCHWQGSGGCWQWWVLVPMCLCASLLHSEKLILVHIKCFSAFSAFFLSHLTFSCVPPSVYQSTSWLSHLTPTGRRCYLAVWPNLDTLWASSAGVS